MYETLSTHQMANLLALIEEAHKAKTQHQFRQILIHGTGSFVESVSCVWTEFGTDLFVNNEAQTSVAEISDETIDTDGMLPIFNAYAYQHPVIAHVIQTGDPGANAISDKMEREVFKKLELYRHFYALQGVEDQMSIGFLEAGQAKALSIHRNTWGFTEKEHQLLMQIAACTFSYYKTLPGGAGEKSAQGPVIQINTVSFENFQEQLGITKRQAELLSLVAHGKSNKQIARHCLLSEGTVRKHLENCFRRLEVNNRVSAITTAMTIIESSVSNDK